MTSLSEITLSAKFNYVGVFLTFRCNYHCSYCINKHSGSIRTSKHLSAEEWILGLNRLVLRSDLPLSIQGGEPTIHQGFYEIINGVRNDSPIDLLTNLQFTTDEFKSKVHPNRIRRESPYPSVRVSYHPQMMDLDRTIEKILNLQNAGYSIGLFGVMHPEQEDVILSARERCRSMGIDFRVKDFLGHYQGKLYGDYCYPEALDGQNHEPVMCRNSEMLIDPSGFVFRCHHDVYNGINPIGHILDPELNVQSQFRPCTFLGRCNPCDIKLKTNRFQQFGHCSVEITGLKKNISEKQFAQAIHT